MAKRNLLLQLPFAEMPMSPSWIWSRRSDFPALEAALAAVMRAWINRRPESMRKALRVKIDKRIDPAASQFLDGVAAALGKPGRDLFLRQPHDLPVGNNIPIWYGAVGSRLRRVVQEALLSPTNVRQFRAARTVVILGAGASLHAGLPCTEDVLPRIRKELSRRKSEVHHKLSKDGRFKAAYSGSDYERLFSELETVVWAASAFRQPLPPESNWLKELLWAYRNVLLAAQFNRRSSRLTRRFLSQLDGRARGRWAIISFNQDTVVETEALKLRRRKQRVWHWSTGFAAALTREWPRGSLQVDVHAALPSRRIYKPHGSVALVRPYAWPLRGLAVDKRAFVRPSSKSHKRAPRNLKGQAPLLLPPSYLKIYEDDFITNMVARMTFELLNAQRVICIGFRMRPDDSLIASVMRIALEANSNSSIKQKEFLLVGPGADESSEGSMGHAWNSVLVRLRERDWKVTRLPMKFEKFIQSGHL